MAASARAYSPIQALRISAARNAVDFDDLILLTLRLFREHSKALGAAVRSIVMRWWDEYQDTPTRLACNASSGSIQ
jgi:superfamily I DNA/RNA helicase